MSAGSLPVVSVLMPVYNAAPFLIEAVESIRGQSLSDWEVVAVDDGSTDGSGEILDRLAAEDSRIRVIHQKNAGIHGALNRGLEDCHGEFVARMDADDVSLPERLVRQVEFLKAHIEIGAVGSAIETFGIGSEVITYPSDPEEIRLSLFLGGAPVAHAAAMIRSTVLRGFGIRYDPRLIDDQGLWLKISSVSRISNLSEVLYLYRKHASEISTAQRWVQTETFLKQWGRALEEQLTSMGMHHSAEESRLHIEILFGERLEQNTDLAAVENWLSRLVVFNRENRCFSCEKFDRALLDTWKRTCRRVYGPGPKAAIRFMRSSLLGECAIARLAAAREAWRLLR